MLNVLPLNMMAIAMGLHVRCGIEDNIWTQQRDRKMGSVEQIEQLVRISREFGREIASAKEARRPIASARSTGTRTKRWRPMASPPTASAARPASPSTPPDTSGDVVICAQCAGWLCRLACLFVSGGKPEWPSALTCGWRDRSPAAI